MRITHPRPALGRQKFIGIEFRDGVARVEELDPEVRQALGQHGYPVEAEVAAVALEDLTVRELRDIAEVEGIELPARASKAELIDIISRAPAPPAVGPDDEPLGEQITGEGEFAIVELADGTVIGDGESIATLQPDEEPED